MKGVNKAIVLGTLGRDPEVKYTAGGSAIVNISAATSEKWKDKNTGENVEKTEWHRIVIFGKLAEIAAQYLKKGSSAYFEGKIQTRKWQDQNGQDRYTTEIVANVMQMVSGYGASADNRGDFNQGQGQPQQAAPDSMQRMHDQQGAPADDSFDDIPF